MLYLPLTLLTQLVKIANKKSLNLTFFLEAILKSPENAILALITRFHIGFNDVYRFYVLKNFCNSESTREDSEISILDNVL